MSCDDPSRKRKYGQFFSTNADTILKGFEKPADDVHIIEPFAGKGDLIKWIGRGVEEYDIEPVRKKTTTRDTLRNPPLYSGKYVVTNPPYLARNKSKDKSLYDTFGQNDLFKIFIQQICTDIPDGGILIIPVNFWSSCREPDIELRKNFLRLFNVSRVNVFEEAVFDDTSCAVCAIQFTNSKPCINIPFYFFPDGEQRVFIFHGDTNYTIGWDIISLMNKTYTHSVSRVLEGGNAPNTFIKFRALDDISLEKTDTPYYGKKTSRTFASLNIVPAINQERQIRLIKQFNDYVSLHRAKYRSLWLSNYREGARKRMGFEMCYSIISHLLEDDP